MKTAMQEVIHIITDLQKSINNSNEYNIGYYNATNDILRLYQARVETEKQQIIEAYQRGYFESNESDKDSETYYTSTFETNKETLK